MSIFVPSLKPTPPPVAKAGPLGPGAGPLLTEFPLGLLTAGRTPQERMRQYAQVGISVPWVRAAERVIGGAFASVDWHLEDENDETIDDDFGNPAQQEARALIEKPMAAVTVGRRYYRTDLWRLTCRWLGLTGNAFWFLDQMNAFGIPSAFLPIRPDRLTPVEDDNGNLTGWLLDRTNTKPGIGLRLDQVLHFMFEPPDAGHFGVGLVESAQMKAALSTGLDKHLEQVLSSGGRLSGFLSPKAGDVLGETQYQQLVSDFRTVVEQPDAAKRLQVMRGPVDFTPTTMSPQELHIVDLMQGLEDDLLALWGVPKSMLGLHDRGKGLGASTVTDQDHQTLWQNAVIPRLTAFREPLQFEVLDRFAEAGGAVEMELDTPEFDDEGPQYTMAQSALNLPLRNRERRELVGLEPFGDDVYGESGVLLDDEVWMPATMVMAYAASADAPRPAPTPEPAPPVEPMADATRAADAAGETHGGPAVMPGMKAALPGFHAGLTKLRANLDRQFTPRMRRAVLEVLSDQKQEITSRLRRFSDVVAANPRDATVWWDGRKWDARMTDALRPQVAAIAESVNSHVSTLLAPKKADPAAWEHNVVDRVLHRGAAKVTGINETTRRAIADALIAGMDEGLSPADVADVIEGLADRPPSMGKIIAFDEYRAELIARTEMTSAYNGAAIESYRDAGLSMVEPIDGDEDPECQERLARGAVTLDEALADDDHPNGTLDWVPSFATPEDLAA